MKHEISQNLPKLDDSDLSRISGGADTAGTDNPSEGNPDHQEPSLQSPPLSTLDIKVGSTIGHTGSGSVWITF